MKDELKTVNVLLALQSLEDDANSDISTEDISQRIWYMIQDIKNGDDLSDN